MTDAFELSDEHLVSLSKDGNLDAFNRLVERHQGAVYNLCFRLVGERQAAEDATQETFLNAYRAIPRFEGANVRGWLFRIAANASKDELRRRLRRVPQASLPALVPGGVEFDVEDQAESVAGRVERAAVGRGIHEALAALPFEQRQAVVLSDVYGYHYEEIAAIAGTSVGTVKSRIHRGRDRMRRLLGAQPELFGLPGRLEG